MQSYEQQPVGRKERAGSDRAGAYWPSWVGWGSECRMHNSYLGGPEKGERRGKEPLIGGVHILQAGNDIGRR